MMHGDTLGTRALSGELRRLAGYVLRDLDEGRVGEATAEDARRLMEGAVTLWERVVTGEVVADGKAG